VSDRGIVLPGSTVPVQTSAGRGGLLDAAGITLTYLAASTTDSSAMSAGLEVRVKQRGPTGDVLVTLTFGRARASPLGSGEPEGASAPPLPGSGAPPTGVASGAPPSDAGVATAPSLALPALPSRIAPPTANPQRAAAPPRA